MPELDDVTKELMHEIEESVRNCLQCNFCMSSCPVFMNTRGFYSLGGSGLTQSLYYAVLWDLFDGKEKEELMANVYRCTTCNACVNTCKNLSAGIPLMEIIECGRKLLVEKAIGPMPDQRKVLESIYMYGNPYGQAQENRMDNLKELEFKRMPRQKAETLLFVGCSTSYEPSLKNIARSMVKLFHFFGIDFGILEEEKCSADTVIRLGDEVLFEELSGQNTEAFGATDAKTIVTISPHDFNVFSNEYPALKDNFEIKHYTEFLAEKVEKEAVTFKKEMDITITYHDPCYLSKHNEILDPPRKLIKAVPKVNLVEMKLSGMDNLCCGGGGGRMFTEVQEEERLSDMRIGQAIEAGAEIIATACPWCHIMLENSVRDLKVDDKIKVMDVAEILAAALDL